jgi:predicted dehydrogenase
MMNQHPMPAPLGTEMPGEQAGLSRDIRIGIVGAGEITRKVHLPVLQSMPDVRIVWLADADTKRSNALGRANQVPALGATAPSDLPACDIALLAIPVEARAAYLEHFAAKAVAVFCEKPFATSAAVHRRILEMFPAQRVACGYMRRLYQSVQVTRHVLTEGWLGPLQQLLIHEGNRSGGSGVDGSFLDDVRFGASRGVLSDLGSHTIDLAIYLTGARRFEVLTSELVRDDGVDRKSSAIIRLGGARVERDVEFHYGVSWLDRQANRAQLNFARCSLWFGLEPAARVYLGDPAEPAEAIEISRPTVGATTYYQAFYLEWQAFLAGIRRGVESTVSAESSMLTTAMVEQLLKSGP